MKPDAKIAISWIELILISLLVLSGMGIWIFVEQHVGLALRDQEPREEKFQQIYNVPTRQSDLSIAQAELRVTQEKLTDQRLELVRQISALESMTKNYPQLSSSISLATAVPSEILQTYIENLVRRETALNLINSLSANLTMSISDTLGISSTLQAQTPGTRDYFLAEAKFSGAQARMAGLKEELIKQQLDLLRQSSSIDSLTALYPELSTIPFKIIPPKTLVSYIELKTNSEAATRYVDLLNTKLITLTTATADRSLVLAIAQQSAAGKLAQAQEDFVRNKRLVTLATSAVSIILVLIVAFLLISWLVPSDIYRINKPLVFGCASAIICVLFVYQAFLALGAALISTLIFVMLLGFLSKYISKPREVGGSGGPVC